MGRGEMGVMSVYNIEGGVDVTHARRRAGKP